uniref:DUF4283 domain-containing protein n=1 Tax=Quercus lobata TaxID=97700 RepID=A0A7N2M3U9_QUELO
MDDSFNSREYGWTDSSELDGSAEISEEIESDFQSYDEDEVPFAHHGPVLEADSEEVAIQREFWSLCAIGFILDCREFSVNHLQQLINHAWRIRGPWSVDGALFVLEKWRPNLVLDRLQLNFVSIWVQLHGLSLEYQYPELAERMGQLMGTFEL